MYKQSTTQRDVVRLGGDILYSEQEAEWEKTYGTDSQRQYKESVHEQLKNSPKRTADYQQQRSVKNKGAR